MTKRLTQLRRLGLIERRGAPDDGRVSMIVLTARGVDLTDAVVGEQFSRNQQFMAHLSRRERERMAGSLRTVLAGLAGHA